MNTHLKSRKRPIASIIIPAYNEELVLDRCLRSILKDARRGEFEIVVVCNGCNDQTAFRASLWSDLNVYQTSQKSRRNALDRADTISEVFPRIYMSADIVSDTRTMRNISRALSGAGPKVAGCRVQVRTDESSIYVKAFYALWRLHPSFQKKQLENELHAVNRASYLNERSHFQDDAGSEDLDAAEPVFVEDAYIQVEAPKTMRELVEKLETCCRRECKVRKGHVLQHMRESGSMLHWKRVLHRPWLWPLVPIYSFVTTKVHFDADQRSTAQDNGLKPHIRSMPHSCTWDI